MERRFANSAKDRGLCLCGESHREVRRVGLVADQEVGRQQVANGRVGSAIELNRLLRMEQRSVEVHLETGTSRSYDFVLSEKRDRWVRQQIGSGDTNLPTSDYLLDRGSDHLVKTIDVSGGGQVEARGDPITRLCPHPEPPM